MLDTSECVHGRIGQGARHDLADRESSGSRKPDSPELLQRHEQIDETVGQLRDQGMMQKEIAATTGLPFGQVQDSYQRLEGEQRAKRRTAGQETPPKPTNTAPTSPVQEAPADTDALDKMVTLFRTFAAKTKRQLVARLLRELSDEERAEVLGEIGGARS